MFPLRKCSVSSLLRPVHSAPQDDLLCSTEHSSGDGSSVDEGVLMSQLYTALKDFDGLEEIDRALGIPALVEQVRFIHPKYKVIELNVLFWRLFRVFYDSMGF